MANLYELHTDRRLDQPPGHAAEFQMRAGHKRLIISFILFVLLPLSVHAAYVFALASDRFVSYSGFSVGAENSGANLGILDSLTSLSGGAKTDSAIVYDFLRSPAFVERLQQRIDVSLTFSPRGFDALFWPPPDSLDSTTRRWRRLVSLSLDSRSGVISARVSGFQPDTATNINRIILDEAATMLSALSQDMREDSTATAKQTVDQARADLSMARKDLTEFRAKTRIVDPAAELEGRLGLMALLQSQLVEAKIALGLLKETSSSTDARAQAAARKVSIIEDMLEAERQNIGRGEEGFAETAAEFESRQLEVEYAQERYVAALAALDASVALAQSKSRYLAIHIQPTQPDGPELPRRWRSLAVTAAFLSLAWVIFAVGFSGARREA